MMRLFDTDDWRRVTWSRFRIGFLCLGLGLGNLQCTQGRGAGQAPPERHRAGARTVEVSPENASRIGRKIWQNESGGTVQGLTAWNRGEAFPSLGIGHFIWYPAGVTKTFEESFPGLLAHLQRRGRALPDWLTPHTPCPWPNRDAFMRDVNGPRLTQLRALLADTVPLQTEYIIMRLQAALPKMKGLAGGDAEHVERQFYAVAATPNGIYALIDYVNFKGEGTNPAERYQGQGWGLLQVLQGMSGRPQGQAAVAEFAEAAKRVLARRIEKAPRKESQWKAGWFNRVETYKSPW